MIIQSEMSKQVVNAIRKTGNRRSTLIQSSEQEDGERPEIRGHQIKFNSTDVIITGISNSKVESVVSEIIEIAHTGEKGDGKSFISEVIESYDITTKEKSED